MSDSLFALIVTLAVLVGTLVWVPCLHLCKRCFQRQGRGRFPLVGLALLLPMASLLTGCALTSTAGPNPVPGVAISGTAMGGQQPISGAKVYLLAANPAGYGSPSLSLLTTASTLSTVDSIGAYATTLPVTGSFNVSGDYDCTQGYALGANTASGATALTGDEQVYLLIRGGNPGSGTNSNIGLMAALGPCGSPYTTKLIVNELTTVAAAYAFAGYSSDATHLASSGSSLARLGLTNAGLTSSNLVSLSTGLPVASSTGVTRPVATLYTLANMLATCVNGTTGNSNCGTLLGYTESAGTTGTASTETATAAINLAHNPWPTAAGMTALFGLVPSTGAPFSGSLSSQPPDFTMGLQYTGGGINSPYGIAIDAFGNAWTSNTGNNSLSKLSNTGTALSPSGGYVGAALNVPQSLALDAYGNIWAANFKGNTLTELTSTGQAYYEVAGFYGGGLNQPTSIAFDASGYVWVANYSSNVNYLNGGGYASKFYAGGSSNGTPVSATGYLGRSLLLSTGIAIDGSGNAWISDTVVSGSTNGNLFEFSNGGAQVSPDLGYGFGTNGTNPAGIDQPGGLAIDASGNVWTANFGNNSVSKLSSAGNPISPSAGYTGGGLSQCQGIAIDGSGYVWVTNADTNSVSKLSNAGAAISPARGYTGGGFASPYGIAIDGSGNVWAANSYNGYNSVTELVGAATPVVTPLVANLITPYTTPASKP